VVDSALISVEVWMLLSAVLFMALMVAIVLLVRAKQAAQVQLHQLDQALHTQALDLVRQTEQLSVKTKLCETLKDQLDGLTYEHQDLTEQLAIRQTQLAEMEARSQAERANHEEKIELLKEARDQLKQEFQNLANQIFDDKTTRFSERSQKEMGSLLSPLREQLSDFKRKVEDVYVQEAKERRALHAEIHNLKALNQKMSQDAINLTQALRGDAKTQGNWGEVILERVLEESGLRKGHEYQVQVSITEQQQRYQPDVIIHLPDGKDVIVDAKVSLNAYEQYCSAERDNDRAIQLKAHLHSLRQHIKGLSEKAYQRLEGVRSLDFVLMFVPIEGAFLLALEQDGDLFKYAFDRNIVLVSPATLLVTLRTIHNIWRYEHQNQNAQEIAKRGADLYDKFVTFTESMDEVGRHLDRAQASHHQAVQRLSTGRGNLVQQAMKLNALGVSGKKSLTSKWSDAASDE
jgi:DNA recombination protein RmuC